MEKRILAVCVVVVLLIIFAIWESGKQSAYKNTINGFWEAPDRFCNASGLKTALVYFQSDKAYIYMDTPKQVLINKMSGISLSGLTRGDTPEYTLTFDEDVTPLPQQVTLRYAPVGGMLAMYTGEDLQLELYKDCKTTCSVS